MKTRDGKNLKESVIERHFVRAVSARGGVAAKMTSPGMRGAPDRIVFWPGGRIAFVELKRPGRKPSPLQRRWHERLQSMGFRVYVIDSFEAIDEFIRREAIVTWD